jgi:hypothetical protein
VAWVPSWHGGVRAARFHRRVDAGPQERPERHRCPAGDWHHRRSPWPQPRATGSSWSGKPLEQSAPGLYQWPGRAPSFGVRLVNAARTVHGSAFGTVTDAVSSAGVRAVADQFATRAVPVPVPIYASANRGSLHAAIDNDATYHSAAVNDAYPHADAYRDSIYRAVAVNNAYPHGAIYRATAVNSVIIHGAAANRGAVHAGPELAAMAGALRGACPWTAGTGSSTCSLS